MRGSLNFTRYARYKRGLSHVIRLQSGSLSLLLATQLPKD